MLPRYGNTVKPVIRLIRITLQEQKPEGVNLPERVANQFKSKRAKGGVQGADITHASSAFTFDLPIDSLMTVEDLTDAIYSQLAEKEQELKEQFTAKVEKAKADK
jgi:hypothetical protein